MRKKSYITLLVLLLTLSSSVRSQTNEFPSDFLSEIKLNMDPLDIVKKLGKPHKREDSRVYSTYNDEVITAKSWIYLFKNVQVEFFIQFETVVAYTFSIDKIYGAKPFSLKLHCLDITLGETSLSEVEKAGWREYIVKHSFANDQSTLMKSKYKYARVCYGGGTVYYGNTKAIEKSGVLKKLPTGRKEYPNIEEDWIENLIIYSVTSSFNQYDSEYFGMISYDRK